MKFRAEIAIPPPAVKTTADNSYNQGTQTFEFDEIDSAINFQSCNGNNVVQIMHNVSTETEIGAEDFVYSFWSLEQERNHAYHHSLEALRLRQTLPHILQSVTISPPWRCVEGQLLFPHLMATGLMATGPQTGSGGIGNNLLSYICCCSPSHVVCSHICLMAALSFQEDE